MQALTAQQVKVGEQLRLGPGPHESLFLFDRSAQADDIEPDEFVEFMIDLLDKGGRVNVAGLLALENAHPCVAVALLGNVEGAIRNRVDLLPR